MIYSIYLLSQDNSLIWEFVNPYAPRQLIESLSSIGHSSITDLLSAMSSFGKDLFRSNIKRIEYENFQIFLISLRISSDLLKAIVIVDNKEKISRIEETLRKFVKRNDKLIKRRLTQLENFGYDRSSDQLQHAFLRISTPFPPRIKHKLQKQLDSISLGFASIFMIIGIHSLLMKLR